MKKKSKSNNWLWAFLLAIALISCDKDKKVEMLYTCPMPEDSVFSDKPGTCPKCGMDLVRMENKAAEMADKVVYTCPMPEDSIFSDKPGVCPKCGMDLVKMEAKHAEHHHSDMEMEEISAASSNQTTHSDTEATSAKVYTCPMHPQIVRDKPGQCPICGMDLVEKISNTNAGKLGLGAITESVNKTVIASIATVNPLELTLPITVEAAGYITYNPKSTKSIASRYAGRIEKLYVKYNFESITKGQKLMEIYSPELVTSQENLLFLLQSDAENEAIIQSARQQLQLLGMSETQIRQVEKTGKSQYLVSIYSPVSGHVHDMSSIEEIVMPIMQMQSAKQNMSSTNKAASMVGGFSIREGMYVDKGQTVFSVIGTEKLWAILKIHPEDVPKIKLNQPVEIFSEMQSEMTYEDKIDFIEPSFESDSKYLNVRVYLDNTDHHQLKIGSLIKAKINAGTKSGIWIPKASVLDLGNNNFVVFLKSGNAFTSHPITAGMKIDDKIEVKTGLSIHDEIAINAQYLVDSEGFVAENK